MLRLRDLEVEAMKERSRTAKRFGSDRSQDGNNEVGDEQGELQ